MKPPKPCVYVIDDDASVLQALGRLLRSAGLQAELYASLEEFLNIPEPARMACIVADVRLRGASGLELPHHLQNRDWKLPVIILTAQDTKTIRSEAHKAGAAAFFLKPVDDQALLDAIQWVLDSDDCPGP